jgi:O-antigen/teichoic acid export membrane protein
MIEGKKSTLRRTLQSLDKYTRTDMLYLAKGSFWLILANLLTTVIVLVMSIIFANKIPSETYGVYKYFLSVLGILSITTLTGIGPMVSQAVARGFEGSLYKGLKTKILYGSIGGCVSIGIGIYYLLNNNFQLALIFAFASIFIPFMDSLHIYQNYLQGKKLFDKSSIYISISQAIASGVMIATVFLTQNIYIILLSYLLSWTGIRLFYFIKTTKKYPPNNQIDPKTISLGKHSSYIDIIATLIGSLDSILIFHYLGSVELAIYSFAIAPITQLVSLFRNIPTLATPKMANRSVSEINKLLFKRILTMLGFAILITIVYIIFAKDIYGLLFPQYLDSIFVSKIYALTMLISIPLTILSAAVNAKITYFSKKSLYLWNIPGALSTIFMLLFIQRIGVIGVAYARILLLVSTAIISYLFWLYVVKKDKTISDKNPEYPQHTSQEKKVL